MEAHGCGNAILWWKLQLMEVMEASIPPTVETFIVFDLTEAPTNLHGRKSTATNFHGSFHGSFHGIKFTSIDFHGSFHGIKWTYVEVDLFSWKFPWTLVETSMKVDRTEVGGPLWKPCLSSWTFEIHVEVGGSI